MEVKRVTAGLRFLRARYTFATASRPGDGAAVRRKEAANREPCVGLFSG